VPPGRTELLPTDAEALVAVMVAAALAPLALHWMTTLNCGTSCSLFPGVNVYVPAVVGVKVAVKSGIWNVPPVATGADGKVGEGPASMVLVAAPPTTICAFATAALAIGMPGDGAVDSE
jgi:hypothetical protein